MYILDKLDKFFEKNLLIGSYGRWKHLHEFHFVHLPDINNINCIKIYPYLVRNEDYSLYSMLLIFCNNQTPVYFIQLDCRTFDEIWRPSIFKHTVDNSIMLENDLRIFKEYHKHILLHV